MPVILILNDKQGYPLLFLCSLTKWPVVSTKTISSVNFFVGSDGGLRHFRWALSTPRER